MRYFNNREECDRVVEEATDPTNSVDKKVSVMIGAAGESMSILLALRCAVDDTVKLFGDSTGNEVHDAANRAAIGEALQQLKLATDNIMQGAKDITWNAEICQCHSCRIREKEEKAQYN